ncbi:MAG: hypothetical protein NDI81_17295 [Desulfobacula sp.]|nr:hypothetical protein [Desulfobacula sp.]
MGFEKSGWLSSIGNIRIMFHFFLFEKNGLAKYFAEYALLHEIYGPVYGKPAPLSSILALVNILISSYSGARKIMVSMMTKKEQVYL